MGAHTGMYVLRMHSTVHSIRRSPVCPCVGGSRRTKTMDEETLKTLVTQIVVTTLATLNNPAQTVTQAVTTVANKASEAQANIYGEAGFNYLSKVKLPALKKAGVIPYGTTVKQALEAGLMDSTRVDPAIATQAPTAGPAYVEANMQPTEKQLMRMTKKELVAMLQG